MEVVSGGVMAFKMATVGTFAGLFAAMLALASIASAQPTSTRPDATLTLASDLARDGRDAAASGRVLVVLYSSPGCPWCARVRREYLAPMQRNPEFAARMIVREVSLGSDAPLVDPRGAITTHRDFARSEQVRMTPTTAFIGAQGKAAAPPIVGFPGGDFFGAYFEERLASAIRGSSAH
jgi:thioredoxin-related protein